MARLFHSLERAVKTTDYKMSEEKMTTQLLLSSLENYSGQLTSNYRRIIRK